jgi:hypothetical protein
MIKPLIVSVFSLLLVACPYKNTTNNGGAIIVKDWQIAAKTLPDGSLDWARIVPPAHMQPQPGAVYSIAADIDHTGQWSIRIFADAP